MDAAKFEIYPLNEIYRDWANKILEQEWGSTTLVTNGMVHDGSTLPGFVAVRKEEPVGLVTYRLGEEQCEVMSLNSFNPGIGIGSALLAKVREKAEYAGCRRLWLITTNDNISALSFYQKRGFSLAALHRNAVTRARKMKPQIPEVGKDGIPLRDELELEIVFT